MPDTPIITTEPHINACDIHEISTCLNILAYNKYHVSQGKRWQTVTLNIGGVLKPFFVAHCQEVTGMFLLYVTDLSIVGVIKWLMSS